MTTAIDVLDAAANAVDEAIQQSGALEIDLFERVEADLVLRLARELEAAGWACAAEVRYGDGEVSARRMDLYGQHDASRRCLYLECKRANLRRDGRSIGLQPLGKTFRSWLHDLWRLQEGTRSGNSGYETLRVFWLLVWGEASSWPLLEARLRAALTTPLGSSDQPGTEVTDEALVHEWTRGDQGICAFVAAARRAGVDVAATFGTGPRQVSSGRWTQPLLLGWGEGGSVLWKSPGGEQ